ncbi:MAG: SRPBCC family protein [Ginsengibacter sp.]
MSTQNRISIKIENTISAPVEKVWDYWSKPEHIIHWSNASDDWHTPHAENDFHPGGKFSTRMEAKDGSVGFDFNGVNDVITLHEYIEYTMGDGRKVQVYFKADGDKTNVTEIFEAESTNSIEVQRGGWQAILDNFKKYAEGK